MASVQVAKTKVSGRGLGPARRAPESRAHTHNCTHRDFGGGGGGENASIPLLSLGNSKANEADLLIPVPALLFGPEAPSVGRGRSQVEELHGPVGPPSTPLPQLWLSKSCSTSSSSSIRHWRLQAPVWYTGAASGPRLTWQWRAGGPWQSRWQGHRWPGRRKQGQRGPWMEAGAQ